MGDDDALDVIHRAERIVYAASWRVQEETVLQRLAGTRGLACARLEPSSEVIQLVTYDGEHLGHIRRETKTYPGERWVAVLKDEAKTVGSFPSALAAAETLAQAAGKTTTPSAG
jgi:hypothetical protein